MPMGVLRCIVVVVAAAVAAESGETRAAMCTYTFFQDKLPRDPSRGRTGEKWTMKEERREEMILAL